MANDLPQWLWLHGNKQIPLGRSLATSQTWNLSGTQLDGYHKVVRFFHVMGFSFLGALAWVLFTKQFLAFLGTLWCCKIFLDLFIPGLGQSLQFLALGQTGVPGQLATTYQFANGVVGGTELQEFLALVLFNQVCSNGHWFVLLVLDLAAEGDVHHGWLQLAASLGLANPHPKKYWANACPQKHVAKDVAKTWLLWVATCHGDCAQNTHFCFDKLLHVHPKGEIIFDNLQNKDISGETNSQFTMEKSFYKWANALVPPTPFSGRSGGERSKRPTCAVVQTCKCYRVFEGLGSVNIDCGTMNRMY